LVTTISCISDEGREVKRIKMTLHCLEKLVMGGVIALKVESSDKTGGHRTGNDNALPGHTQRLLTFDDEETITSDSSDL